MIHLLIALYQTKELREIGKSKDPAHRCEFLNHHSPTRLKLLHYTSLTDEATVHKKFQQRKSREWFYFTQELADFIDALKVEDGKKEQASRKKELN
jgi:hypothetical protein